MTSYSCSVKVVDVTPQDFGAIATVQFEQGGGIDISPPDAGLELHISSSVQFVKTGAVLTLTLSEPAA